MAARSPNMAYANPFPTYTTNPLSPQREMNARPMNAATTNPADVRGTLSRRFTTNALPTLSPIGPQRRQAVGTMANVSVHSAFHTGDLDVTGTVGFDLRENGGEAGMEAELVDEEKEEEGQVRVEILQGTGNLGKRWLELEPQIAVMLTNNDEQTYSRIPPSERKTEYYESLLAEQKRIEAEMANIDDETRRQVDEHRALERDVNNYIASASEPTTPPEYQDTFPTAISRPNRYSSASMTSPPGFAVRPNRAGSQLTSPPSNLIRPYTANNATSHLPSKSVPGSRRNSDEESDDEDDFMYAYANNNTFHRSGANPNRNSMPVTGYDRQRTAAQPYLSSFLGPVNTTSFLFGGDDKLVKKAGTNTTSSPDAKTYLQLHATDDKFPILVRRQENGDMSLSASSAALDLALSQSPGPEAQQQTDRSTAARHRISLPPSALRATNVLSNDLGMAQMNGILADANAGKPAAINRRSQEVKFSGIGETKRPGLLASPPHGLANGIPKPQSSYSTNDIPTLKSINGNGASLNSPPTQIQQVAIKSPELNSSILSRVTSSSTNTAANRQSQDFSAKSNEEQQNGYLASQSASQSAFQANAAPFAPTMGSSGQDGNHMPQNFQSPMSPYAQPAFYGGYGMNVLSNGFGNMYLGNQQGPWPTQMPMYQQAQAGYGGYQQIPHGQAVAGAGRFGGDSQARVIQQRRQQNGEESSRYNSIKIESLVGEIYSLCKDQHGCRYLQKKIDDRDAHSFGLIFDETNTHVVELMTDPFGNYLIQKMLEVSNEEQRTILIHNAAPQMVHIALNQHGTRALQKMIEFISTRQQIEIIIDALRFEVVQLIQDLNGNHVIQKCLNHLNSKDAQFIFDAVGQNCVTVGTHRHGCCVLQRCIDHATGPQKAHLIRQITDATFPLVQDPFGNYVIQYILDLNEPAFSKPLCLSFCGHVIELSKQKFSSNVVEKCIRTADNETKRLLVDEMVADGELEKLLRDSFANYVVQTAMDFGDATTKSLIIEHIRPILPSIRHTPYGRRIQGKIQDYDNSLAGLPNGQLATFENFGPARGRGGFTSPPGSAYSATSNFSGNGSIASPTPQRNNQTYAMLAGTQNYQNHGFNSQAFSPMGRAAQPSGYGQF